MRMKAVTLLFLSVEEGNLGLGVESLFYFVDHGRQLSGSDLAPGLLFAALSAPRVPHMLCSSALMHRLPLLESPLVRASVRLLVHFLHPRIPFPSHSYIQPGLLQRPAQVPHPLEVS